MDVRRNHAPKDIVTLKLHVTVFTIILSNSRRLTTISSIQSLKTRGMPISNRTISSNEIDSWERIDSK